MNSFLIDSLDKATDKVASMIIDKSTPILVNNKILIGNILVEKENNSFTIKDIDGKILYDKIDVYDVAIIVAQSHISGNRSDIKQVLALQEKYLKYRTDMIHYLHCMRSAKKNNDYERLSILEDKFQFAELFARDLRDKITHFKRIK